MPDDLYIRLAEVPPLPGPAATTPDRDQDPPGTAYTASIETVDTDYVGSLLYFVGP